MSSDDDKFPPNHVTLLQPHLADLSDRVTDIWKQPWRDEDKSPGGSYAGYCRVDGSKDLSITIKLFGASRETDKNKKIVS